MIINRAGSCKIAAKKPNFDQSRGQLTTQPVSVHRKPAVSEPSWSRGPTLFGGKELYCKNLHCSVENSHIVCLDNRLLNSREQKK